MDIADPIVPGFARDALRAAGIGAWRLGWLGTLDLSVDLGVTGRGPFIGMLSVSSIRPARSGGRPASILSRARRTDPPPPFLFTLSPGPGMPLEFWLMDSTQDRRY